MPATTKANEKIRKLFNISVKSIDEEKRQATFVFSDNSIDRYGEIVDQSWDTKNYEKNPIVLWGHDPQAAENAIGTAVELTINDDGKSLMTAQFDDDPHASLIFNKIKKGILRTVSAGFIPHTIEYEDDVPVLKDNELLEVSVVAIPANPNAVALAVKAGEINKKEAAWLMKSMREEADLIEAQLSADEAADPDLAAKVAELEQQLQEANDAKAALEAENAELKEAAAQLEEPTPPANGGDDDQPGAGDDEIDLEAELTDEELEELDVPDDEDTNE